MDIFPPAGLEGRAYLRRAVFAAAQELGILSLLAADALSVEELARRIDVAPRRLGALLDVLVLEGALDRRADAYALVAGPPVSPLVAAEGWGRIAEVIRGDRPIPAGGDDGDGCRRFHEHLVTVGAESAGEVALRLAAIGGDLLDAGGGAGVYTAAYLDVNAEAQATLVDLPPVIALARETLARFGDRVRFTVGDLLDVDLGEGHGIALAANLLHLHPPPVCVRLVARLAASLAPGGSLVVRDLRLDEDRRGPPAGLLFALNMAIFTDGGTVHDAATICDWLRQAGLVDPREEPIAAAPESQLIFARRPTSPSAQPHRAAPQ